MKVTDGGSLPRPTAKDGSPSPDTTPALDRASGRGLGDVVNAVKNKVETGFHALEKKGEEFERFIRSELPNLPGPSSVAQREGELHDPAWNPGLKGPGMGGVSAEYREVPGKLFLDQDGGALSTTGQIAYQDISQGQVGDCHFMSSLATVARNHPEVIKNAIRDNGNGTYTVRLYVDEAKDHAGIVGRLPFVREIPAGKLKPVDIVVDGKLPVDPKTGEPVFSHPARGADGTPELWVPLMEKAYAKYYGSYSATQVGLGANAMEMLTGVHSQVKDPSNLEIEQLAKAMNDKQGIVATTYPETVYRAKTALNPSRWHAENLFQSKDPSARIYSAHAYSVMSVDVQNKTVTLANPWGAGREVTLPYDQFKAHFVSVATNPLVP